MKKRMKNPCWKGYKAIGTKMKNGRKVPNCVPVNEELGPENEWGTPALTKKMLAATPGQTKKKLMTFKEFDNTIEIADLSDEELDSELDDMLNDVPEEEWEEIEKEYPEGNENEFYYSEEVLVEKGLTPMGRVKKALSAKRSRQKRTLAKNMSLGRPASQKRLMKRAKLAARRIMYKRLLRGRSRSSLSSTEKARIESMLKRMPMQSSMSRAAVRLAPNLRKLEGKRITKRRKGKK